MSSSTGTKYATGKVAATGAELKVRTVGFYPRRIRIANHTNQVMAFWCAGMAIGAFEKTVAAGTRTNVAAGGPEPLDNADGTYGIKLPILVDINDTAGEDLLWEAWD